MCTYGVCSVADGCGYVITVCVALVITVTSHTWQAGDSHRAGECLTRSVQLLEPLVSSTRCDVTHKQRERAGVTSCGWGTASAARLFVRKGRCGQR